MYYKFIFFIIKLWASIVLVFGFVFAKGQITQNPKNDTVCYNTTAYFIIKTSHTNDKYTWQDSSSGSWYNLSVSPSYSGITNDTLTISNAQTLLNGKKYRCIVDSAGVGTKYYTSSTAILTVYNAITLPTIMGSQSICYNTTPDTLKRVVAAGGGNGSFTYQWQNSVDSVSWKDINGATGSYYINGTLLDTTFYYRLKATTYTCAPVYSNIIKVLVFPVFLKPTISGNQSICYNTQPSVITRTSSAGGGNGVYSYQWQNSTNGISWTDINGQTGANYQSGALTDTTYYRQKATTFICNPVYSDTVKVIVYGQFIGTTIAGNDTICFNTKPDPLTSTPPTGGDLVYSYQWQKSIDNIIWQDLISDTLTQLQPNQLTTTTYYKLISKSGSNCGSNVSNTVKVLVYLAINPPSIMGNQNVCYGDSTKDVKLTIPPTGGNDLFSFIWQYSTGGGNWKNSANDTNTFLASDSLTSSHYYRIAAISDFGCDTVTSDSIYVNVYPKFTSGNITASQNICYNTSPGVLQFDTLPSGGGGSYTYQWEQSNDSITFSHSSSDTNKIFSVPLLKDTIYYKVSVTSLKGCGTTTTNISKIVVYDSFIRASIGNTDTVGLDTVICYNAIPGIIKINNAASGGATPYTYQWLVSDDNLDWQPIAGGTLATYTPGKHIKNQYYKLITTSSKNCGNDTSNTIKVTVNPLPDTVVIIGNAQNCRNQQETKYELSKNNGLYDYKWELAAGTVVSGNNSSKVHINWHDIAQTDTIKATQTIKATGCSNVMKLPVTIVNSRSPGKAIIIQKPNSPILVCNDTSTGLKYQWGYIVKTTGITVENHADTLRYVHFSSVIDTSTNIYYVRTNFSMCSTTSYYLYNPVLFITKPVNNQQILIYPNPTADGVIKILTDNMDVEFVKAINVTGQIVGAKYNSSSSLVEFDASVPAGMYVMVFSVNNKIIYTRVTIQK